GPPAVPYTTLFRSLVAPQAIAPARVIRAMALSRQPLAVLEGSTRARAVVRPVLSAQARRSRAPAWPMMFLPSLRTDRFWFQRVVSCTRRVLLFPASDPISILESSQVSGALLLFFP